MNINELAEKVVVVDGKMHFEDGSNYGSHKEAADYIYSNIYNELNDQIDQLYLRGQLDYLCRVKTILCKTKRNLQKELNSLEEKYNYENDFEAMLDGVNYSDTVDLKYIYTTKNKFVAELIDSIDYLIPPPDYKSIELEQVKAEISKEAELPLLKQQQNSKNDKYAHYTALQWGAIIHYAHEKELNLRREKVDDIISAFKNKHNIKLKESTLRSRYYEAAKKITDTFDYKSILLEKTIPFFNEYYKHLTEIIQNEVEYLKENEEERIDNK